MTARNAQGRFVSAQQADALTAERVLERAVEEAVTLLRRGLYGPRGARKVEADHLFIARGHLAHAGHAADLLLSHA